VQFEERRLEDVVSRLNRFERNDEAPFEAAAALSEFNQRAYELFARPLVQATANPLTAQLGRQFHKLRVERWAFSDLNPMMWWLKPVAGAVKAARAEVPLDDPARAGERLGAELLSASLDLYKDLRDAQSEAQFFRLYGNLLHLAEGGHGADRAAAIDPRELPFVQEALAAIDKGGYAEAVARCACLLRDKGKPLPLEMLALKAELMAEYGELLPAMDRDAARRIRGEQEIIVDFEPDKALATLPALVADPAERARLVALFDRLLADERIPWAKASAGQQEMLARIRGVLAIGPRLAAVPARKARKAAPARNGSRARRG